MNFKKIIISSVVVSSLLLMATPALAHVVVKPNTVGIGAFQTFTTGVPNEKDMPTVGMRVVIPAGLKYVSPNVKPGWTIAVKKSGEGEEATVTEISWTGGAIPAGQRDEFLFSAQAPASATTLKWKAYQTYEDGTVVSWDQEPKGHDDETVKPYSETKVVNDLKAADSDSDHMEQQSSKTNDIPMALSIGAIIMSGFALFLATQKKK